MSSAKSAWPVIGSALLLGAAAVRHFWGKKPIVSQPKPADAKTAAGAGSGALSLIPADAKTTGFAPKRIRIVPMRAEHVERAGKICEDAFNGFAVYVHQPELEFHPGLPALIFNAGLKAMAAGTAYVVVAVDDESGAVVGSNMIDIADGIGGIGPISVDPAGKQLGGVGRQLMQAVIDWAVKEKGIKDVRLVAICDNKVSWSLYSKLGFTSPMHSGDFGGIRGNAKLLAMPVAPGLSVRKMTADDVSACDALVRDITPDHKQGRAHGIADSEHSSWCRLVCVDQNTGSVVGFTTGFRIDGFTYARSEAVVQSLLCEYARAIQKLNPQFDVIVHIPLRLYPALVRWALNTMGLKLARQVTVMQLDLTADGGPKWADPIVDRGFYLHNISY